VREQPLGLMGDDVVEQVADRVAVFVANLVIPNKPCDDTAWITVRSATVPNGRVTPTNGGPSLAWIQTATPAPAILIENGAHHWRFLGIAASARPGVTLNYGVIVIGVASTTTAALPRKIVLDRVYAPDISTCHCSRDVALGGSDIAIVRSYLSGGHIKGADSQAILGGWGPGPYLIEDNYLAGAGENVMFGGVDPKIAGLVPSDITIRRNHFFKPLAWKPPSGAGSGPWSIKNLFELKNAQRVLVEGNILENNFADAQDGFALVWKDVNQYGSCTWCVARDVTYRYNILRKSPNGINIAAGTQAGVTASGTPCGSFTGPSKGVHRFHIEHNIIESIDLRLLQFVGHMDAITYRRNTMTHTASGHSWMLFAGPTCSGADQRVTNLIVQQNTATVGQYGIIGTGTGSWSPTLTRYAPSATVTDNVLVPLSTVPLAGNIAAPSLTAVPAGYGADRQAVLAATAGVVTP
jgi:hypothetical protein